ncbi:unnamed protein product [Lymnaea stagnalis]|uniref:G-protein coupled receptors family 1 profile domain-containing protein n=1 Tax=Lymnaea stagnalis TaxID=6523 RepID=A0AAV2IFR2_LYMST
MIPALTFLSLLLVTGVIGSSLVLLVYWRKRSKTPEKVFILVVAVYDLLINSITIPGEIYQSLNDWDFDHPTVCRIQQYFSASVVIGSGLVLVAIAGTRYVV